MGSHSKRLSTALVLVLVVALALSALVFSAPPAKADYTQPWTPGGNGGFVSTNPGFARGFSTTIANRNGHFYVFYYTRNSTSGLANLNVSKFDDRGSLDMPRFDPTVPDRQVNTVTNTVQAVVLSSAVDHSGNVYVAYVENRGSGNAIYVSKSTNGGATWPAEAAVSNNAGSNIFPAIAVTPSGTAYVAWEIQWGGKEAIAVSSSADGVAWSSAVNVTTPNPTGGTSGVSIAIDTGGRIFVGCDYYNNAFHFYAANITWSDDGTTWSAPTTISNPNGNTFYPNLLADASGVLHAAWIDQQTSTFRAYYARSSDRGSSWTPPVVISGTGIPATAPRVSLAESGAVLMASWEAVLGSSTLLGYGISPNHGGAWQSAAFYAASANVVPRSLTVDENGTFYQTSDMTSGSTTGVSLSVWFGPPSVPTITEVARGTGQLTVSWTSSPEPNLAGYRVYRSSDGITYSMIATTSASESSYADTGLANGTYWYEVQAVNDEAIVSNPSVPASGAVGPTTQELLNQLNAELATLQAQLNAANTNLAAAQAQLTAIRNQLSTIQGNTSALQRQIDSLQNQLNNLQAAQATQTISYANLAFEVIVVVLLVVLLLNQMRRPKAPQMMMAQPGQVAPMKPEDEL